jgi:hypothetical protein
MSIVILINLNITFSDLKEALVGGHYCFPIGCGKFEIQIIVSRPTG